MHVCPISIIIRCMSETDILLSESLQFYLVTDDVMGLFEL